MSAPPTFKFEGSLQSAPSRIVDERAERLGNAARALKYHHTFLDDLLRGLFPNDLVLLGAETGAGKTDIVTGIAKANARAGKRVTYFALEAEPREIERRIKYTLLAELALAAQHPQAGQLNYPDWIAGRCEAATEQFDQAANQLVLEQFGSLRTFYRGSKFDHEDIQRQFHAVANETDLIVLDHLHYVDIDESQARGFGEAVKMIRDVALIIGKPVILVAHLRKRDQRARQLVPHIEDFHGSSDLIKIATQVIQLAPGHCIESAKWYQAPTFINVPKDRRGGTTGLVALCMYDRRYRSYAPTYTLGRLTKGGTDWEQLKPGDAPRWATGHRAMEAR